MTHVITKTGFECEIDEGITDDYEVLELIRDSVKDKPYAVADIVDKIFVDKTEKAKFMDACRNENGRVSTSKVSEMLTEVFNALPNGKKY